ncbi:MAG: hypothetical protein KJZ91_19035 [Myxococcales bacterium]|nr:hypothetical protein [Myxococcales bacterium]
MSSRSRRPMTGRGAPRGLAALAVVAAALAVAGPARADGSGSRAASTAKPSSSSGSGSGSGSAAAAAAGAVDDDLIGLLDVRVEGVSDAAAEVFTRQIEESLGIAGLKVAGRARLREFLAGTPWNAACLMGTCLRELKTHAGVGKVIEATLVSIGPSYHYTLTLLDTGTGAILRQASRKCDVCTTDEAFADAALGVVELITEGEDLAPAGPGRGPAPPPGRARRTTRRAALALMGAAALAGAGGYYLLTRDEDRLGAAAIGASGAFAVAGVTCLGISFSF